MTRRTVGLCIFVVVAAEILLSTAQAAEDTETDHGNCEASYYGCPCPENLSEIQRKFHITPPKGMTLIEASCTTKSGAIYNSYFKFEGDMTLKGTIRSSVDEMGYNPVTFEGLKFSEIRPDLNLPPLPDKDDTMCLTAPAVIRVRVLEERNGGGDEDGTWIRSYEVLKLGEYKKCKLH